MKELFQQYAAYNIWATKLLVDRINKLPEGAITQEIPNSFPSLYKTIQHMWMAEEAWWQRLKLVENLDLQSDKFTGTFAELTANLAKQSQQWAEWVNGATESQITHVFAYIRNKEQIKMPVYQMLQHVFNHATYHRGQLVTMLRQLGESDIPSTDFSAYCRSRKV